MGGYSACTQNENYAQAYTTLYGIDLCYASDCLQATKLLKHNDVYERCLEVGTKVTERRGMKIEIFQKTYGANIRKRCVDQNGQWLEIDRHTKCLTYKPLKFTSYSKLDEYEVYVVSCGNQEQEFADEGHPRTQIVGFDIVEDNTTKLPYLMFPTQYIKCVTNCKEVSPTWTVSVGADLVVINNTIATPSVIVKTEKLKSSDITTYVTAECAATGGGKKTIQFYIADFFNSSVSSYMEGKKRIPENAYDAGEKLSCIATSLNTKQQNTSGTSLPLNIAMVTRDNQGNIISKLTNETDATLTIPENLTIPSGGFGIICYLGNYESEDPNGYLEISMTPISLGARYMTKLTIFDKPSEYDVYDFNPNDKVKCNLKHYENLTGYYSQSLPLYILYATDYSYPMSKLTGYADRKWDNASYGELTFKKQYDNMSLFAFCYYSGDITTPVQVFAGDRPTVTISYIHPRWKTEYQLIGFVIMCTGTHIDDISATCLECLPESRIDVDKVDQNHIKLIIPKSIKKYTEVTYKCIGYSSKYVSVFKEIQLKIIVSEITDIDTSDKFFYYGHDSLRCLSFFTVTKNGRVEKESIIVPVQMQVDGAKTINEDGSNSTVLIIRNDENVLDPNTMVSFQACCPLYEKEKYSCLGQWKTLNVARDYNVRYNLNLDLIYPGNVLKCFICVNLTSEIKNAPCVGLNSVPSKIKMSVTDPNGTQTITDLVDEVRAPVEGIKPDQKEYYKISDYTVKIGCQSRGPVILQLIMMKSCNQNPPKIKISPPDKTMFVVGDIFSCTTDDVNCKNGLKYSISVQRGSESADIKEQHSFMFEKKHTGNNINLKCVAGESGSSSDERMTRVEIGPYNVSINTVLPIMQYKQYFRCHSLGFPPPTIVWSQLKGSSQLRISETFLLIGPWDYSGEYTIQCEAKNKRGSVTKTASFKVFNPRITFSDFSSPFYFFIPLFTVIYIILLGLSVLIIFQEHFFGVPFFSKGYSTKTILKPQKSPANTKEQMSKKDTVTSSQAPYTRYSTENK